VVLDLSELDSERLPLLKIALRELHQFIQLFALVVAAYGLMHRPPHQLHRVALRRPRGQRMQTDATPEILHIFLDSFADVAAVIVNGQVQLLMTER
jgi:hypothetical protein